MGTKCNGCDGDIADKEYIMECSQGKCKKRYHLICLAVTKEKYEAFTEEYKKKWVCPLCVSTIPKRGNSDTPVRGSITTMDKTFTDGASDCYVNTKRGSRRNPNDSETKQDTMEHEPCEVLREFQSEIIGRLDEQIKQYTLLQERFIKTETELQNLRKIMEVVQEKANKVDMLEEKIEELLKSNELLQAARAPPTMENPKLMDSTGVSMEPKSQIIPSSKTFVDIINKNQKRVTGKSINIVQNKECAATKSTSSVSEDKASLSINEVSEMSTSLELVAEEEKKSLNREENWTVVNKKKNRYTNKNVKRGGSTTINEIQGTEKNKYLHVWRLQKETKEENLEIYVRNICGLKTPVKVERIKQKTERDYASFMIGVPESKYDMLCQPEKWPINVEFCEWIWFRRPYQKPKPSE